MQYLQVLCIFVTLISIIYAETLTKINPCVDAQQQHCTIHEIGVNPCAEAPKNGPCKMKINTNSTINFVFTPHFSATSLKHKAYSAGIIDMPLPGMDEDGCKGLASCPLVAEQKQSYKYDIYLSHFFPPSRYTVKWRLWNADKTDEECCFTFKIKLSL